MVEGQETQRVYVGGKVPVEWVPEMDRVGRVKRWTRAEVIREAIRQYLGLDDSSEPSRSRVAS